MFKSQTQILKLISIILLFTLTLTANTSPLNTTYTQGGLLKTATDASGTIAYTYDNMGGTTRVDNSDGSFVAYAHDNVGNIIEVQTPTQTIAKTYDELNRLKTVVDATGTTSYTYDAIGRQTEIKYPNGTTTSYTFDNRNRVTNITHKSSSGATLQSFTYTLDAVGNRVRVVEDTGRTVSYTYNNVNQLTQEIVTNDPNGNNTTTTYIYDLVGNLVTKIVDGTSTTYTYNNNDQLTQQDTQTFTYDGNGNLIQKDSTSYEYDDKNRLIKVTTPTQTIEYSYDANDNRIAKVADGATTSYLVDTNTPYAQVISETKGGATVEYIYGNDLISNGSQFFLTDALGSTRGLVDSSETLTDSYNYTPYGELTNHTGTSENNFLFTGEQLDKETEDYYLRARYYSPNSTRFISRDTYDGVAGNPITQNHYLYGNANPAMYVDPSGYVSMLGLSSAMSIRNTLSNIQITSYTNILDASFEAGDIGSSFLFGMVASVGGRVAYKLLLKLSSKFRSATKNGTSILVNGAVTLNKKIVRRSLQGVPYRTYQKSVSIPKIEKFVDDMLKGDKFPSIKVDGNIIVEGHHRYIASRIANVPIGIIPGTLASFKKKQPSHELLDMVLSEVNY